MRRFISPLVIAPLVIVGLLAGCGSDSADVVETQAPMTEAPTSEAPADELQDIVTIASGNEDFSTLVAAVGAAGLVETLQGEAPHSRIFRPNVMYRPSPDSSQSKFGL